MYARQIKRKVKSLEGKSNWQADVIDLLRTSINWQVTDIEANFYREVNQWGTPSDKLPAMNDMVFEVYNKIVRTAVTTEWDKLYQEISGKRSLLLD
jgi:hypothetical protein